MEKVIKTLSGTRRIEYSPEEIAELERQAAEMPPPEPTTEERVEKLEQQISTPETATDAVGNKYRQEIGTDGTVHLILVESYTGELYE